MINKEVLTHFTYNPSRKEFIDSSILARVFEPITHELNEIKHINYLEGDNKSLINSLASMVDQYDVNISNEDVYLTTIPSTLYKILINNIKVPTISNVSNKFVSLSVASFSFDDQIDVFEKIKILTALSFLNLNTTNNFIVTNEIIQFFQNNYKYLKIDIENEFEVGYKDIVLNRIDSEMDTLGKSHQKTYQFLINTILSYKSNNPESNTDPSRFDNLQYLLIDQQLRFEIFKILQNVINSTFLKFSRQKGLVDSTGNLYFRVAIPSHPIYKNRKYDLKSIIFDCLDNGFIPSYSNIADKIEFLRDDKNVEPSNSTIGLSFLIFRLCGVSNLSDIDKIDDLILNKNYDEAVKYLKNLIL